ncbi:MAG: nuclear transport factor 2 family protein, partial [Solirubrobacteraceae bacterium]
MAEITTVVDGYIAMWNETSPERRRSIIADTWTDDAGYLDPIMSGDGPEGIDAMVAAAQQQFPGHRFELTHGPDAHHDRVRFAWKLVPEPGGRAVAAGVDFGLVAADGRLRAVTGFLEPATT